MSGRRWPAQFNNLNDPRFCAMYLKQMPCTASRHAEAIKKMQQWLVSSVAVQDANDFMRGLTKRAKDALTKHTNCTDEAVRLSTSENTRCPNCGMYGGHTLGCITYRSMHSQVKA